MAKDREEEALFRSYPSTLYFVQSPSTASHAHTTYHSPFRFENLQNPGQETLRLTLSHYSSSRGSNNSILHETCHKKKCILETSSQDIGPEELDDHEEFPILKHRVNSVGDTDRGEDEDEEFHNTEGGWSKYFSFSYSNSGWWLCLQLSWRLLFSFMVALIVFWVAAKPPAPKVSIQMGRVHEFRLGEGVDGSGVTTKILSCNFSMHLTVDNKSKLFGLHIRKPILEIIFGHLPFAMSRGGDELYAGSNDLTVFKLSVGTRNKPMYGAGRIMTDLLESGKGLPLIITVRLKSNFHVVSYLFETIFHHRGQCLVLLANSYDKKHRTQSYGSRCVFT